MSARMVVVFPPRLAHEPEPLAALECERDAPHRVELHASFEIEPDMEVFDSDEGLVHRFAPLPLVAPAAPVGGGSVADGSTRPMEGSARMRKRRTDRWPTASRGFSASSIAAPVMVAARTTIATQTPGGTIAHHALFRIASSVNAFSIRRPQEMALSS